jgi:hypothetical protein
MEPPPNLIESVTRLYTDSEIELLIDEISEAAHEAIEQAASEAAKAAALASIGREAALLRQAQYWRNEAELRQKAIAEAKRAGRKNAFNAALIGIAGGLALGASSTLIIGGR